MDPMRGFASRNAFRELEEMADRFNRLVTGKGAPRSEAEEKMTFADWTPAVDVLETEAEYLIQADLPGVSKDDVKISVQDGVLTLSGQRQYEKEEKNKKYHRIERAYGSFARSFTMPDYVDDTKVTAQFKDGMLAVHLPKSERAKPKSIEVKVG